MAKNFTQFSKAENFKKPLPKGDFPVKQQSGSEINSGTKPPAVKPKRDRVKPNEQVWVNGPAPKDGRKATYAAKYARTGSLTEAEKQAVKQINESKENPVKRPTAKKPVKEARRPSHVSREDWAEMDAMDRAAAADGLGHRVRTPADDWDEAHGLTKRRRVGSKKIKESDFIGSQRDAYEVDFGGSPTDSCDELFYDDEDDPMADPDWMDEDGDDLGGHYVGLERDLGRTEYLGESKRRGTMSPALREAIASYEGKRKRLAESEEPEVEGVNEDFVGIDGGKDVDDVEGRISSWLYNDNSGLMKTIVDGWVDRFVEYGTTEISENKNLEDAEVEDEQYILEQLEQDLGISFDSETYDEYAPLIWDFMIEAQDRAKKEVGPIADMDVADFKGDRQ